MKPLACRQSYRQSLQGPEAGEEQEAVTECGFMHPLASPRRSRTFQFWHAKLQMLGDRPQNDIVRMLRAMLPKAALFFFGKVCRSKCGKAKGDMHIKYESVLID